MIRKELETMLSIKDDYCGKKIIIWGTGNTTSLYQEGFNRLEREGFHIFAYADNNEVKWNTTINGIEVLSPSEVEKISDVLVLITSPQPNVIRMVGNQLDEMNVCWMHVDEYILCKHKDEVLKCFDLLEDARSKAVYAEIIKCHLEGRYPDWEFVDKNQYYSFGDFSDYNPNEIFVDCGAFVGDSLERYIWEKDGIFKKIYAFEPDEKNVEAMNYRIQRLKKEWNLSNNKIQVYPYGLSDSSSVTYISRYDSNNGFGSKIVQQKSENVDECRVVSLDDVLDEGCSFIKADIESYEYKMILGAKETIKKYRPKMAICIYHNCVDLYSIMLLIKEINKNYKFAVRHYTHMLSETVLYVY